MERIQSATPPAPKNAESEPKPVVKKSVTKSSGPSRSTDVKRKQEKNKKQPVSAGQEAGRDFDLALAALHAGDFEAAAALVEKLRRAARDDPSVYDLAAVQVGLLAQDGKDFAQRQRLRSALQAFAKQARAAPRADPSPAVDRSV